MGKRILVADDEPHIARLLEFKLQREGYEVTVTSDGGAALDAITVNPPDMVILDIMMPVMTGTEVLAAIQADDTLKDIPVILLTARGQERDVVIGFDAGAVDYIVKPFAPSELLARIKRHLDPQE
jgi:DNA-binding response OmpR family regulator